jgi:hypothetical protein
MGGRARWNYYSLPRRSNWRKPTRTDRLQSKGPLNQLCAVRSREQWDGAAAISDERR